MQSEGSKGLREQLHVPAAPVVGQQAMHVSVDRDNPFTLPSEGDPRLEALKQALHSRRPSVAVSRGSSARSQPGQPGRPGSGPNDASRPLSASDAQRPGVFSERVRSARAAKCAWLITTTRSRSLC